MLAALSPDVMTSSKIENEPANSTQVKRRVLIVDDHPVFRHGITALINAEHDLMVCGEASSSPRPSKRCEPCGPTSPCSTSPAGDQRY